MKKSLKAVLLSAGTIAGFFALSAETITYLLSHRKANLDFLLKNEITK